MATLKETIMGCVCGDNSCHKTIYNMFYPTVYNVCMRYSSSKQEGEDFIQESFIKIFDNIEKFDTTTALPNIKFGAWAKKSKFQMIRRVLQDTSCSCYLLSLGLRNFKLMSKPKSYN